MENEKKTKLSEEYLRKFNHRIGYAINESPKYHPLVGNDEEFDDVPELTNEAGEQEDALKPDGQVPPEPSNDIPIDNAPVPAFDANEPPDDESITPEGEPMIGGPQAADAGMGIPPAPETPDNEVNDIQNDIIKHNIEAMKSLHDQLAGLDSTIQTLNSKMNKLSAEVEEVREPTDAEKLMNKTNVSYPYYFNLNDFWKDNWFDQKRAEESNGREVEQGMKELPDGTYVADFDDLPQKSKIDIQNSFNDII